MVNKTTLRHGLLARRKELSLSEWQTRSALIVGRVQTLCETLNLATVALYAPVVARREVDVSTLDAWLRARRVEVAYPIMAHAVRGFALSTAEDLISMGGFLQPPMPKRVLEPGELDLIVVPALGVTTSGYRLGYGAGFYDQQLRRFCPPAISVCVAFKEQMVADLPLEPHDEPCAVVISDA
jgi:5-formyltetrahydrofolate cyclo-ligase